VGLEPAKSQPTASMLLLLLFRYIGYSGSTTHSLSKFVIRLNHVIDGPLVYEVWRPPDPIVILFNKRPQIMFILLILIGIMTPYTCHQNQSTTYSLHQN